MIHNIHTLIHCLWEFPQADGAIDFARGKGRRRVVEAFEGGFPEIGKFVMEVGDLGLVGAGVEEGDEAGVGGDEVA